MHIKAVQDFDQYLAAGDEATAQIVRENPAALDAIRQAHTFIAVDLWGKEVELSAPQAFLAMNSLMLILSGLRMTLTGHLAATFPLFRTAVESACYAYVMRNNDQLAKIWLDRHSSAEAFKASRKSFGPAVADAARGISQLHEDGNIEKFINDAYQAAIDFGAHPNPHGVMGHIQQPTDGGDHWMVPMVGIYDAASGEIAKGLIACLEYTLAVAIILANCQPMTKAMASELDRLLSLKEKILLENFGHRE